MISIFCGYSGLITFLGCFGVCLFVFFRDPTSRLNQVFAFWSLNVSVWALSQYLWFFAADSSSSLLWARVNLASSILLVPTTFHLLTQYLRMAKKQSLMLGLSYLVSAGLLFLNYQNQLIVSLEHRAWFSHWVVPSALYHAYPIFLALVGLYLQRILLKEIAAARTHTEKKRLKVLSFGTLLAFFVWGANLFLSYGISVPPVMNLGILLYAAFMTYIVLNQGLWDNQLMVRRTIVFTGIFSTFLFVFVSMTYTLNMIVSSYIRIHSNVAALIAFAAGILMYRPAEKFLIGLTDHFLFQKKYDYQQLLRDASRGMSNIQSLERLLHLVVHFITMKMRVKNAAVLTWDKSGSSFRFSYQRGYSKYYLEYRLDIQNPLIRYLSEEREAIDIEIIKTYRAAGNKKKVKGGSAHKYDFDTIEKTMRELDIVCCVPSFLGRELRNILILGEKKSGEHFSKEDLNVLFTLAQESSIALENARLYDEAINKSSELQRINEQLEYSKGLLMKALQETEVANKQLLDTQAQLIHEQKMATLGRLAASVGHEVNNPLTILSMNVSRAILKYRKNTDLKVSEILELFQKMEQNIGRIKAVVNTLTGLLKKSEKGKFEPLSLKLILEETLPLVQFQTYLDNLTGTEVDMDVPGNIPLVRGDLERLQEVFLNLFINAYHAMSGKQNRRIRVRAEVDPGNSKMVVIKFTDNGSGMSELTAKKIFNYGFTTKAPGKGSGLGLYMCKYIIELHGGDIKVSSELGQGTTFSLTLPIYEEESSSSSELHFGATR